MIGLPHKRFHMLLRGHVLDRLRELPDESVDCIMTSPPYYGLRMYRGAESQWGEWHGQLGLEPDFGMYLDHLLMVTAELKRVLKKSGTLWWNMGDSYASSGDPLRHFGYNDPKWPSARNGSFVEPTAFDQGIPSKSLMLMPERLAMRMVDEQQWVLRNMNIWHKPNHMPSSVSDRLTNSYEFVMLFTKAQRYFFDLDAIRVPLSPVTLKEIEKEYNGTSLKDYGGAMAQDASESKRRIVKSLQKYRSGNRERKVEQFRLSHLGSSIPWTPEDSPGGKNPGDVLHYDSKYVKDEYGQPLQGFVRDQSIAERRQKSREEAAKLFPGDAEKQQEYINFVHDHNMHPLGKNPGDVFATKHDEAVGRTSGSYKDPLHTKAYHPNGKNPGDTIDYAEWYFNEREKKSWHDHKDDMEKGMHHTGHMESIPHPFGKYPDDFWEVNPRPHPFAHFAVYPVELCIMPIKAGCPKDGVVLDPFAGSGTTGVAARQLGRSSILIEVSDEYCKIAKQRMEWGQQALDGTEWIEE